MTDFAKKTKKASAVLLCVLLSLTLLLTACGKDPEEPGTDTDGTVYYTVTFDSRGGSAVPSARVPEGTRASEPTAPSLENFVFKGWMYNGVPWDFSKRVTEDMTLTASWENASQRFEYTVVEGTAVITGIKVNPESSLVIPATVAGFPVTAIGESAFADLTAETVTSLTLPTTVTAIGAYAFQGCSGISISLSGAKITSIGEYAFEDCDGLGAISFGEGLTEIPASAFLMCTGLTSVTLPTTLTKIDESAFEGCENLSSLLMHKGVSEIGHSAFRDCDSLSALFFGGNAAEWDAVLDGVEPTMNTPLLTLEESEEIFLYSEAQPEAEGSFWHYDQNRMPKIW